MAICRYCYQDMLGGSGCIDDALHFKGVAVDRIRFGSEVPSWGDAANCGSCGTARGSTHHPGCSVERCKCEGQAISCDCLYDEDPPLDWDDVEDDLVELLRPGFEILLSDDGSVTSQRRKLPLESVTKPLELRYQSFLDHLEAWGHDYGEYPAIRQLLALGLHGLAPYLNDDKKFTLRRPATSVAMNRIEVLVEDLDGGMPTLMVDSMAALLTALFELGRLETSSDPLDALIEPLGCHYGFGGRSLLEAAGTRPCRCFLDFDPFQPSNLVLVRVQSGQVVEALAPQGTLDALLGPEPLHSFANELDALESNTPEHGLVDLRLYGVIQPSETSPRLWVYGRVEVPGPHRNLILDDHGVPFWAFADDRSGTGFVWEEHELPQAAKHFGYDPLYGPQRSELGT